jgi:hypothetical protein
LDAADNLWTASLRREQLLELLDGRGPRPVRVSGVGSIRRGDHGELLGIWSAGGEGALSPLPQLIVASQPDLEDLFAWSASYLRAFGPLSAIVRTLTPVQFDSLLNSTSPPEPWKLAGGAIGLIIGEILSHNEKISVETAAAATPNSTLAFAMLRAWYLGFSPDVIDEVFTAYTGLGERLQRFSFTPVLQAVKEVAATLTGAVTDNGANVSRSPRPQQWIEELKAGANLYKVATSALRGPLDLLNSQAVERLEEMTAEARVQFFDGLAPTFTNSDSDDRLERAFSLALATFVCRPGLEQQASLMREHARRLPEAWLWLGALQAFSPMLDALSLNSGAGWRIARELFRPEEPWASPRADAGIGEIQVLARGNSRILDRLIGRARLDVEIYPMITAAMRGQSVPIESPRPEDRRHEEPAQRSPASATIEFVQTRLEELLRELRQFETARPESGTRRKRK